VAAHDLSMPFGVASGEPVVEQILRLHLNLASLLLTSINWLCQHIKTMFRAEIIASCEGNDHHGTGVGPSPEDAIEMAISLVPCGSALTNIRVISVVQAFAISKEQLENSYGVSKTASFMNSYALAEREAAVCYWDGTAYSEGASCPDGSGKRCCSDGTWS